MKIAVRYQSRGGNTKAVAEAIAKAAGVKAEPISTPFTRPVDLLFIGGGVYGWDIDPTLVKWLETLDPNKVKTIAAYSTAGGMNGTKKIKTIAEARGINVREETLPVKLGVRNHTLLGGKGYIQLTEKQIHAINEFVKNTIN